MGIIAKSGVYIEKNWKTVSYASLGMLFILLAILIYIYTKPPTRILIIADDVFKNKSHVKKYLIKDGVLYAFYNNKTIIGHYNILHIMDNLMATNDVSKVTSVGLMYHSPGKDELGMFSNAEVVKVIETDTSLSNLKKYDVFILFARLIKCRTGATNLDMISCSLVQNPDSSLFKYIDIHALLNVNASTNITGGEGEWVLEQGDRDLIGRYFNHSIKKSDLRLIA